MERFACLTLHWEFHRDVFFESTQPPCRVGAIPISQMKSWDSESCSSWATVGLHACELGSPRGRIGGTGSTGPD